MTRHLLLPYPPVSVVISTFGCGIEYGVTGKPLDETGYVPDSGLNTEDNCVSLNYSGEVVSPANGWPEYDGVCMLRHDPLGLDIKPGNARMAGFQVRGVGDSITPYPNVVRLVAWEGAEDTNHYPDPDNIYSDDLHVAAGSGTDDWTAAAGIEDLGGFGDPVCGDFCYYRDFWVEIQDVDRPTVDECDDYAGVSYPPSDAQLCIDWVYTDARRGAPEDTECEAGSGSFQLVPFRWINHDDDSNVSVILKAFQTGGTGVMTGAAWITQIDVVEDQGEILRIMSLNQDFHFGATDYLDSASTVSTALFQTTTTFSDGQVPGGAPFVLEEVDRRTPANLEVELEWSCGSLSEGEAFSPPKGYVASLFDLACMGSWPQAVTIRPVPPNAPTMLQIELYGQFEDRLFVPLTQTLSGEAFSFHRKRLSVEGTLLSHDEQGADVDLDLIEYNGVELCDPGIYTFLPEE